MYGHIMKIYGEDGVSHLTHPHVVSSFITL